MSSGHQHSKSAEPQGRGDGHPAGEGTAPLQSALARSRREADQVLALASLLGSATPLVPLLNASMDRVVEALSCTAALIYLYQEETEGLALAGANERYRRFIGGGPAGPPEESIICEVARTGRPYGQEEHAMRSPGMQDFAGMGDGMYQAVAAFPLVQQRETRCHGVLCLLSSSPQRFSERREPFIDTVVGMLALAIERERLSRNTQRYLSSLTPLSLLSQLVGSGLDLDPLLQSLAALAREIFGADLCLILLLSREQLEIKASSPELHGLEVHPRPIEADPQVWETLLHDESLGQFEAMERYALDHLHPLKGTLHQSLVPALLMVGTEHIGLMNLYFTELRRFTHDEQMLLRIVATHIALAIKFKSLSDLLAPKHLLTTFLNDLLQGSETEETLQQRASALGGELDRGYVVISVEITPVDRGAYARNLAVLDRRAARQSALRQVREHFEERFPGSLLYEHDPMLTCLVSMGSDRAEGPLKPWLRDLSRQLYDEQLVHVYAGISNACRSLHDYQRGYAEANEAREMGHGLNGSGKAALHVTHFNDLGEYRYFYKIAQIDTLGDMYLDLVGRIADYDRQKDTDLLSTLVRYCESGGNVTKTANLLGVDRNTVIQRLERLQSLSDIDLQDRQHWLALQVASKIYALREGDSDAPATP